MKNMINSIQKRLNQCFRISMAILVSIILTTSCSQKIPDQVTKFPLNKAKEVNPDTHLKLTFSGIPQLGDSGMIQIYDAKNDQLVDSLDLSIPPGPTERNRVRVPYIQSPYEYVSGNFTNKNTKPGTPSGGAIPNSDKYQLTIIGGFTDAFHFYPVIINDSTATIYLHNSMLEYDKTYYVTIDPGVLTTADSSFSGITNKADWVFSTKKTPPPANARKLTVAADGSGDFNTVQGAIDFIPDHNNDRVTIFIKNGRYEEIVYFRNKTNVTFLGEDREQTLICYRNNEVFNPHPENIATNEWPGTFPSRRAAFAGDNCGGIHLVNLTIRSINEKPAQAEGLLLMGKENIVSNVSIFGSGDALQINGSVYLENIQMTGFGDNVLGRGPSFFKNSELISFYGPHMWIRNTKENHGNVFLNCTMRMLGDLETTIARTTSNNGKGYPYCEAVLLNCKLHGIRPEGWGVQGNATSNIHYWEYNSVNLSDGMPVDVSKRHPVSRQLTMEKDSDIIANYSDPAYVLNGWSPEMAPIILSQPTEIRAKIGENVEIKLEVAAIPEASYQWIFDGKLLEGETQPELKIDSFDALNVGHYSVKITNSAGSLSSNEIMLALE